MDGAFEEDGEGVRVADREQKLDLLVKGVNRGRLRDQVVLIRILCCPGVHFDVVGGLGDNDDCV